MKDITFTLKEVQTEHEIRDLQKVFKTMKLVPLVLSSTICLFCLDDDESTSQGRIASFSRIDSLRRHMDDVHLSHLDPEVPLYALTRHVTSPFRVSITSRIMLLPSIMYSCRSSDVNRVPTRHHFNAGHGKVHVGDDILA